jgi:hypothetical protein
MATKLRMVLDTHRRNFRYAHWPATVLDPLEDYDAIVERAHKEKVSLDANPNLTGRGKAAEKAARGAALVKEILDKHTPRLTGLDADLAAHRSALLPQSPEKPDARRIDFMLSHLRDRTPQEIAIFYNSATDEERLVMEAAAASVGRVPMKVGNGLEWQPLLNAETVNESVIARATAKNPAGAMKLQELSEIRSMHVTVASHAIAEIKDVMSR